MPTLKEATKTRKKLGSSTSKAAKRVADQISAPAPSSQHSAISHSPTATPTEIAPNQAVQASVIAVPGLIPISADQVSGMIPQFDGNAYQVTDPLNPPDSVPQLAESQLNRNQTIFEGGTRALKSVGMAYDMTRERFTAEGKKAKAFGAGIVMATEFKKVEGNYLDYLTQVQTTAQKSVGLDVATHKTTVDANTAVHTKEELTQKQELARLKAETAKAQVSDSQNKLSEFQRSLGFAVAK